MGFAADHLPEAALKHVRGRGFGGHVSKPAGAILAASGEMNFERSAFFGVKRTERVGSEQLPEFVAVFHAAWRWKRMRLWALFLGRLTYFFRHCQCLLDTRPYSWSSEVVANQPDSWVVLQ